MDTARTARTTILAFCAAGAGLFLATSVRADTLTFTTTPASNAVAAMSRRYGVSIVFRSAVNSSTPVTFSVDNADTPDGRVQAMNDLGNALGLDFQKVYIVSKADPGTSVPEVKIDNDGPIVFTATKVPAREAIQTVAGVDGALTQISGSVKGSVVFPSRRTTAQAAAATVAKQTGTVWRAYYGFFKRGQEPARLKGEMVDRDINGNPVMALPLVTFRNQTARPVPTTALTPADGGTPTPEGTPSVTTVPDSGAGFGFSPYGFDYGNPYGYGYGNPYGYGGFGYPAPDGGVAYPGFNYSPGFGVEPTMPGMNAPGLFPPGSGVTSVPTGGVSILPDFPITGGGPVVIGGY